MLRVTATEEITRTAEGEVVRWPRDDRKVGAWGWWIVWDVDGCYALVPSSSITTNTYLSNNHHHDQIKAPPPEQRAEAAAGARGEAGRRDGAAARLAGLEHHTAR